MSKTKSVNVNKQTANWLYCFLTTFDIEKKFDSKNKRPDDYAVYKIGKTDRTIEERMKEHGNRVDTIILTNRVYDSKTLEDHLIKLLHNDNKLLFRKKLTNNEKKEKGDTGLEYFEGRYIDIEPHLKKVISEDYQNSIPLNMDLDNICIVCHKLLNSENGLKIHMSKMHNIKSEKKKQRISPPRASASVSRVSPPRASASVSRVSPPRASVSRISPPRASVSRISPPRESVSRISPPRASPLKTIPLQYQLRATKQPKYITDVKNKDIPLYSNYITSNKSKNSNILRMIDRLNINYKKAEKRKRSANLSRSSNSTPYKRAK